MMRKRTVLVTVICGLAMAAPVVGFRLAADYQKKKYEEKIVRGPGGGLVFHAEDGHGLEVSPLLGKYNWESAMETAWNYTSGGKDGWRLPSREELNLMRENMKKAGILGELSSEFESRKLRQYYDNDTSSVYTEYVDKDANIYWSSTCHDDGIFAEFKNFDTGETYRDYRHEKYWVRAVRPFSFQPGEFSTPRSKDPGKSTTSP
jgi:hypothetical protein